MAANTTSNARTADLMDTLAASAVATTPAMRRLIRDTTALAAELRAADAAGVDLFERDRIAAGGVPSNPNAELPECATFQGTGSRCTSCRIRKAMHA